MTPQQQIILVLARILPVSHTRAACQRPTVLAEHGRLHLRCDDTRSAWSFFASPSEGGRHHCDTLSRCLCYNWSWLLNSVWQTKGHLSRCLSIYLYISFGGGGRQVPTRTGCLATGAEIWAPQLGLPASVLDHITLRQQEREGAKQRWR